MSNPPTARTPSEVPLRRAGLAAFLSFLVPGLGQIYQGRVGKGILFMVLLLGTFCLGMRLGDGHVVYWEWTRDLSEVHYPYLCQMFVGLPALPALVQATLTHYNQDEPVQALGKFEAAPTKEQLDQYNYRAGKLFEFGTVYTMVAGLLNILVIYDALSGPAYAEQEAEVVARLEAEKGRGGAEQVDAPA